MDFQRILVPFDFSEAAGHAAQYACRLAAPSCAEVTALHVLEPLRYDFAMTEPTAEVARDVSARRKQHACDSLKATLATLGTPDTIKAEVIEGDPAHEVVSAVNDGRYDAIVMSTRGKGAFQRWLTIGSVTSKVLHAAEKPVITSVHFENHESPLNIRRVMCAIDLGPQSMRVLFWGMQAARKLGAALDIVHAAPPLESEHDADESQALKKALARLESRIEELKRDLNVEGETIVKFDHPAKAISELARRRRADLVVLGRGVSQDVIGRLRATAYDIIRQCPCPVISI